MQMLRRAWRWIDRSAFWIVLILTLAILIGALVSLTGYIFEGATHR